MTPVIVLMLAAFTVKVPVAYAIAYPSPVVAPDAVNVCAPATALFELDTAPPTATAALVATACAGVSAFCDPVIVVVSAGTAAPYVMLALFAVSVIVGCSL